MKNKKYFYLMCLFLTMMLSVPFKGWTINEPEKKVPVITHSFTVERGQYGYIWKIYIEAEDPDGDMYRIASVVDQTGYGRYPTDWIIIKPEYRKHFKGYVQWNTFSSRAPYLHEWTNITMKVSILDKTGNESNVVVFPFTFESGVKDQYKYKLPAPFDQGDLPRLGHIHIELYNPLLYGGNGGRPLE
jgi:hypothetical protein